MVRLSQIRLSNIFLLIACCAILTAWHRDRTELIKKYGPQPTPDVRGYWEALQATGPPDTPGAGDIPTAWASATRDGQQEWLIADYGKALAAASVEVHETYNPGGVVKITGLNDPAGKETLLWKGVDPAAVGAARSVSVFPINAKDKYRYYKIYIDSPAFAGWNEIDAIGVRRNWRKTRWAVEIECSTCYAARYGLTVVPVQSSQVPTNFQVTPSAKATSAEPAE